MSGDITLSRSRTWHFSHTLYTSLRPEAARGLSPTSSIDPWDFIKRMFHDLFEQGPATVSYIHLRVSRQAFDHCVACGKSGSALPDLPFSGFIQATSAVRKTILQRWLDAIWTPVGSKLCSDSQYRKEFIHGACRQDSCRVRAFSCSRGTCPRGRRKGKEKKTAQGSSAAAGPRPCPRDSASGVGRQRGAPFPFLSRPVLSAARRFFVAAVRPAPANGLTSALACPRQNLPPLPHGAGAAAVPYSPHTRFPPAHPRPAILTAIRAVTRRLLLRYLPPR